jgi:phosphoribosylanthranilate isomerase
MKEYENKKQGKIKPYIGVTGFKTKEEIKNITSGFENDEKFKPFPEENNSYKFKIMLGFLASEKRMKEKDVPGKRSPAAKDLPELISHVQSWALPMIHYYTNNKETLVEQIREVFSNLYPNLCSAIQLNVDWPPVEKLEKILCEMPNLKIVLQLPERAMENLSIEEITTRAKEYDELASYVLIDPSGGKGKEFDVKYGIELMLALKGSMNNPIIGIAGGFSPENVCERIKKIKEKYFDLFCIDAEGKLMEDNSLSEKKARDYICSAMRSFAK